MRNGRARWGTRAGRAPGTHLPREQQGKEALFLDRELDQGRSAGPLFKQDGQRRILPRARNRQRRDGKRGHRQCHAHRQDRGLTHERAIAARIESLGSVRRLAVMRRVTMHRTVHRPHGRRCMGEDSGNRGGKQDQAERKERQPRPSFTLSALVRQTIPCRQPWTRLQTSCHLVQGAGVR